MTRLAAAACLEQARLARGGEPREVARLATLLALVPFTPLLPLLTAFTYADEQLFAWRHFRRHARGPDASAPRRPPMIGAPAARTSMP